MCFCVSMCACLCVFISHIEIFSKVTNTCLLSDIWVFVHISSGNAKVAVLFTRTSPGLALYSQAISKESAVICGSPTLLQCCPKTTIHCKSQDCCPSYVFKKCFNALFYPQMVSLFQIVLMVELVLLHLATHITCPMFTDLLSTALS